MFNILFCNVEGITTPRKSVACFIVIIYLIFIKHFQFNKIGRSIQIITSHRISPKRQEPRAKLRKDLHRQFRTAVYDLISDAKRYDSGEFDAIRRSSVTIRTLLYDHKNTHGHNSLSILSQLGLKDSMKFATYFKNHIVIRMLTIHILKQLDLMFQTLLPLQKDITILTCLLLTIFMNLTTGSPLRNGGLVD